MNFKAMRTQNYIKIAAENLCFLFFMGFPRVSMFILLFGTGAAGGEGTFFRG
jgi:hypothetical protein